MANRECSIRNAEPRDFKRIASIYEHYVRHDIATFELHPPSHNEMLQRHQGVVAAVLPWFVADDGNQIIGYAYSCPYRPRKAYEQTAEITVYLAHDRLRAGVGRRLLNVLIDTSRQAGVRELIAVISGTQSPSIRFHEKMGFVHCGVLRNVGRKFNRWIDTTLMQLSLQ